MVVIGWKAGGRSGGKAWCPHPVSGAAAQPDAVVATQASGWAARSSTIAGGWKQMTPLRRWTMRARTSPGARMLLVAATLLSALPAQVRAEARTEIYWGEATDEGGNLLYREKHEVRYEDGRITNSLTSYLDPSGGEFARLQSDYSMNLLMPTYVFEDTRRGLREGLRFEGGRYSIFHEEPKVGERAKVLDDTTGVYSCQGWHYHLVNNLAKVEGGDDLIVRLILPNRLQPHTFKILSLGSAGDTIRVKVRISSWLLSLFVPELEAVYDKKHKRLIEYYGVSNIVDAEGKLQKVHITYQY